ncbi:S41 family peptidase [Chryseobacterium luquanense]|uniref:S41 family peptidase n=1 Tax=Chryseobacterium luquanense TaxID=2983766 RepID=A0ABT3Y8D7_9FLAO|nr:S41 family peptidase [Chryseobacterium luquanense]MCX8534377.1 S41 family peptidase [Chryseobacterium luquanense]
MKKISIIIIFLLFQNSVFAQKNPYYDFIKTWNFIKYYHPDVASGKVDADSLFLNTVKNISSKDDFNSVIGKLSQHLNKNLATTAPKETSKDVLTKNQNFAWFQKNGKVSSENKTLLNTIYKNRYNFELLGKGKSVSDEKEYSFPKTENLPLEYRFLALAKIQGVVDYLFPHKYLMNKDFDAFFKTMLDENQKATNRKDFELIMTKLVAKMEDSHALSFYRQLNYKKDIFNASYFAPFDFEIVDNYLLITKLIFPEVCAKAEINIGDKIISIGGKSISQMLNEKGKLLSVSNKEKLKHTLSKYENNLIWTDNLPTKNLNIKSVRDNKSYTKSVDFIDITNKEKYVVLENYLKDKILKAQRKKISHKDISYFKIDDTYDFINTTDDDKIDSKMDSILTDASKKKAIVFDMRGYPDWGGFVNHFVYKYFSPVENYFYKYYAPNLKNIGTFYYLEDPKHYFPEIKDKQTHSYSGKVFIMVNPETRSASEWYSMSLQKIFPQSLTIGQQTSGADGDLVKVKLPGNYLLEFTGNGIFYPDNSQTQQIGIRMNELIKYSDKDILEERDLEFERVLKEL